MLQSERGSPSLQLPEAGPTTRPGPSGHLREVTTSCALWRLSSRRPPGSLSEEVFNMCDQESNRVFD